MFSKLKHNRASILIFTIWILGILSVFAIQMGLLIRQRITVLSRLEQREILRKTAEAGVKKAIAAIRMDRRREGENHGYRKLYKFNNPDIFKNIRIGRGVCTIGGFAASNKSREGLFYYGVIDEERKLNINIAEQNELETLIRSVLKIDQDRARSIAEAIIDWRMIGTSQPTGFYSSDYYQNLASAYEPKNSDFENYKELLLVKEVSHEVFEKLISYITIYGDGLVNVNTASREVFLSIGFSESLIDKVLSVRRGFDNVDHTVDDYYFTKTFDLVSDILNFTEMEVSEIQQIDKANQAAKLKTESDFYLIQSNAQIENTAYQLNVSSVYNTRENVIEEWYEKKQYSID